MDLLLGGQVVALIGMVAISTWGWKRIPSDVRIRRGGDLSGLEWTMGRTTSLISTPLAGVLVVAATATSGPGNRDSLAVAGLVLMAFLLFAHTHTVRRAAS